MATTANPMAGRYFNDPHFAAAVSNLAGAFAPPSAEEYLTAEKVKGMRTSNSALADFYALAGDNPDMLGVAGDLFDPVNGFEAMRGGLANERYATDVGASTELEKQRIASVANLGGTVLTGDEALAGLTAEQAAAVGLPEFAPVSGLSIGAPATPLNESQMMAAIMAGQSPDDQRALLDPSTVNTVGPNGEAMITSEIEAIGQPAFVNPGGVAASDAITFERNGVRMGGSVSPDGQFKDSAGQPLTPEEAGSAAKIGSPTGTNADLGIGTGSTKTEYFKTQAVTAESDMLIDSLIAEVNGQAGAVGIAGTLQNLQQNVGQVLAELNAAYGDADGIVSPEMLSGMVPVGGDIDPTYARLRSGVLQLAYLNAQRDNPSGEVSRFALERQLEALSQGMLANDQSFLASLTMNKEANARKRSAAEALLGNEVVPPVAPGAPAAAPAAAPAGGGTRLRFDANGDPVP